MPLSIEIKKKIEAIKNEIKKLRDKGEINLAYEKIEELENLNKELEIQLRLEEDEKNSVANNGTAIDDKVDENRAFNKALLGKNMTDSERDYVNKNLISNDVGSKGQVGAVDERGGYLLPETHEAEIREYRRKRVSLKELVTVKNVSTRTGKQPKEGDKKLELLEFDELSDLSVDDLKFGQMKWDVKDYGLLIPVSNSFISDVNANIVQYIGKEFGKASVRTENKKILDEFKKLDANTIDGIDGLIEALNTKLDPAIAETAVLITNQSSYDYLDKLKDKNGSYLLQPLVTEPTKLGFKGKPIVVLPDEELTPKTSENYTFYIGDPEEYLVFFERQGIEVAMSTEAGFKQNATWMRVIERFDVQIDDKKALVLCEMAKA